MFLLYHVLIVFMYFYVFTGDNLCYRYHKETLRAVAEQTILIEELSKNVKTIMNATICTETSTQPQLEFSLPLMNILEFEEAERVITDKNQYKALVCFNACVKIVTSYMYLFTSYSTNICCVLPFKVQRLAQVGGDGLADCTRKILRKTIDHDLSKQFNFSGKTGPKGGPRKKAFELSTVCSAVKGNNIILIMSIDTCIFCLAIYSTPIKSYAFFSSYVYLQRQPCEHIRAMKTK